MAKKAKKKQQDADLDMTPMIDIVFQLIIFFVITVNLEEEMNDPDLLLEDTPNAPELKEVPPQTVNVQVLKNGVLKVGAGAASHGQLRAIMVDAMTRYGSSTEVLIRGDARVAHDHIRKVMDICTESGLWKIKFASMIEAAEG